MCLIFLQALEFSAPLDSVQRMLQQAQDVAARLVGMPCAFPKPSSSKSLQEQPLKSDAAGKESLPHMPQQQADFSDRGPAAEDPASNRAANDDGGGSSTGPVNLAGGTRERQQARKGGLNMFLSGETVASSLPSVCCCEGFVFQGCY